MKRRKLRGCEGSYVPQRHETTNEVRVLVNLPSTPGTYFVFQVDIKHIFICYDYSTTWFVCIYRLGSAQPRKNLLSLHTNVERENKGDAISFQHSLSIVILNQCTGLTYADINFFNCVFHSHYSRPICRVPAESFVAWLHGGVNNSRSGQHLVNQVR